MSKKKFVIVSILTILLVQAIYFVEKYHTSEDKSTSNTSSTPPQTTLSTTKVLKIRYPDDGEWPGAPIDKDGDGNPEFYIEINPWNILNATGFAEMTYNLTSGVLHYVQQLDNIVLRDRSNWVHGYPEIFYGNKPWNANYATDGPIPLPSKVSNLTDFYLTISYKLEPKNGLPINFAIESWLTREAWRTTGINSDEQEVMIWIYYDGLQPAGSKVKEIVVPIIVNGTPVNATFEVWKANIGWEYVAFRIKTPIKEGTVTIPYGAFISVAANISSLPNYTELYLEDVEIGTEFGTPSTTSAHLEWWITNITLTPLDRPLIS
ncbi:GH12 family glycosyl hydrolase domain-containing protein [Pyrococcus woesei]|uniref:GH12 family glycosyl hydrolase domain-containing protein n=1 Tax=Pyrococcus woesei TaxID=2262 RepID=UPI003D2EA78A